MSSSKYDSGEYDHFAGGLTQPEPKLNVKPQPPKRPRYADGRVFDVAGPDINEIMNSWPYRGRGKGPQA